MKWIKTLTCDVFLCVLVSPCLVSGFLLPSKDYVRRLVISIRLEGPGPVATKMPFSRGNPNPLQIFLAPAQEGNLFFLSGRWRGILRKAREEWWRQFNSQHCWANNVGSCHLRPCCGSLFPAFRLSRLHLSNPGRLLRKYLQWWDYFDYI